MVFSLFYSKKKNCTRYLCRNERASYAIVPFIFNYILHESLVFHYHPRFKRKLLVSRYGVTVAAEISFHLHVSPTILYLSEDAGEIQMNFLIRYSLITAIHITVRADAWVARLSFGKDQHCICLVLDSFSMLSHFLG